MREYLDYLIYYRILMSFSVQSSMPLRTSPERSPVMRKHSQKPSETVTSRRKELVMLIPYIIYSISSIGIHLSQERKGSTYFPM
jgi:hypothetical protein